MPVAIVHLSQSDAMAARAALAQTYTDVVVAATGANASKVQLFFRATEAATTSLDLHMVRDVSTDAGAVVVTVGRALGHDVSVQVYAPEDTARGGLLRQAPADSEETQ